MALVSFTITRVGQDVPNTKISGHARLDIGLNSYNRSMSKLSLFIANILPFASHNLAVPDVYHLEAGALLDVSHRWGIPE